MTALVLVAALACPTAAQRCDREEETVLLARTSPDLPELATVDGCGDAKLLRWATPWDVATAWLDGLPPAPPVAREDEAKP